MGISVSKIISGIANSNLVKNNLNKSASNPKYLARFLLGASIAKDIISYTTRVLCEKNNKEIPESERPFIVAMDKASGFTTTAVQLVVGTLVSSDGFQNFFTKNMSKAGRGTFAAISTLVLSTLLAKRILTPLIATPLAEHMVKKDAKTEDEARAGQKYVKSKTYEDWLTRVPFKAKDKATFNMFV